MQAEKKINNSRELFVLCELIESFFFILYERVRVVRHCVYFSLLFTLSCNLDFSNSGSRIFAQCRNIFFSLIFLNFIFCEEWSRLKIILIIFFFERKNMYINWCLLSLTARCVYRKKKIETYDKVQSNQWCLNCKFFLTTN